jgi:glycine cleavage system transcriptional repressor
MRRVAVTAVGQDRPGIVAGFSGAVYRSGGNLEDATMTRLRDEFAMMLLVRVPGDVELAELDRSLREAAAELGLSLVLRPLEDDESPPLAGGSPYMLRLHGADRPGIVHAVTAALSARALNISDLNTRVIPGGSGPVYVMMLEVDLPSPGEAETLRPELERIGRELGVEIGLEPLDAEVL